MSRMAPYLHVHRIHIVHVSTGRRGSPQFAHIVSRRIKDASDQGRQRIEGALFLRQGMAPSRRSAPWFERRRPEKASYLAGHRDGSVPAAGPEAQPPPAMRDVFMLRPPAVRAAILPTTPVDLRVTRSLADHLLTRMVWAVYEDD